MKKLLLGTTALAAAGLAASPAMAEEYGQISLSVGGYYQNIMTFVDQDENNEVNAEREFNPVNVRHEGEIHFKGETTLDNGLVVGFQAQLEAITQSDQMDETYLYFSGSWGRLVMGSENSAPYLMAYAAPYAGLGVNSPNFFMFSPNSSDYALTSGYLNAASDANKVTYFTPRFGGFQLGVSYTPNIDSRGGNRQTFGLNTDEDAPTSVTDPAAYNHVLGAGVNFVESFNSFDIALYAGAEWANLEMDTAGGAYDDFESYQGGINLGFAGFTVGGSVHYNNAGIGGSNNDADVWFWDVGATYGTGPWTVGLTYSRSTFDNDRPGENWEDRRDIVEFGASYALSPGVTLYGALQYMDEETEYDGGADDDQDGFGGSIGTKLSF